MIWQYEWCNAQLKREIVESQSIKRKQQDVFRGSAPSSTSPPSPRRIFNPLGVSNSSLNQYNLYRGNTTTIHLYRRGIQTNTNSTSPRGSKPTPQPLPKREHTTNSTSTKEGANHHSNQPLPKRDTTRKGGYNKVVSTTTNNSFSHK